MKNIVIILLFLLISKVGAFSIPWFNKDLSAAILSCSDIISEKKENECYIKNIDKLNEEKQLLSLSVLVHVCSKMDLKHLSNICFINGFKYLDKNDQFEIATIPQVVWHSCFTLDSYISYMMKFDLKYNSVTALYAKSCFNNILSFEEHMPEEEYRELDRLHSSCSLKSRTNQEELTCLKDFYSKASDLN